MRTIRHSTSVIQTLKTVNETLQLDLNQVKDWLNSNQLSLNVAKTTSMLICNKKKRSYLSSDKLEFEVNGQSISQTCKTPYLGVELDQNLDFQPQFDKQIGKIRKSIGILKRIAPYIPRKTRKTMYNTLILPHIDYCSPVWSSLPDNCIIRLQRAQNRAMRPYACNFKL